MSTIPSLLDCFRQLIATPSVSCVDPRLDQGNRGVVELLGDWLADLGFAVDLMPVVAQPEKFNLIARLGSGPGGLVLAGHTDTVPCDEALWDQDPFVLTEKDQRLYGLGSSDMKCFFPLVLEAVRTLDADRLRAPLYVLATADEESTMAGARALAHANLRLGRHALIGEPTGLRPVHMHKGILITAVRLTGRAGHSSNPALGISALEGMNAVINALTAWRDELQRAYNNERFQVPAPTLNFGSIHGGDNPNRICAECILHLDLRLLPGMELSEFRARLHEIVHQAVAGSGLTVEVQENFDGVPALHTDPAALIVQQAETLTGQRAGAVDFVTEGPCLNALGMQTVVLGPGNIEQAHQANEYLALDRIRPMLEILTGMIGNFCIEEKTHDDQRQ